MLTLVLWLASCSAISAPAPSVTITRIPDPPPQTCLSEGDLYCGMKYQSDPGLTICLQRRRDKCQS